jgi:hypothetical protein
MLLHYLSLKKKNRLTKCINSNSMKEILCDNLEFKQCLAIQLVDILNKLLCNEKIDLF